MNCPYCAKEMETGYLRGGSGYELLWTEEPFKMTSLPTGNDFFVCKASDVYRPIAHLCRTCGKSPGHQKIRKAPPPKARGAFRKNLSHSIRRTAANRPAHPAAFAARRRQIILIVFSDVTVVALRLAHPFGRANRATSSKPARFIRHWRRFAAFHVRQKKHFSARKCGICPPRRANYAHSGLHPPK